MLLPGGKMSIKVLMADDNYAMRSAIQRTLEEEPRIEIVAEASTFAETIQKIADFKPAVLLLDLHPARKTGLHSCVGESTP
jgi:chemotaxis response regulator CheB